MRFRASAVGSVRAVPGAASVVACHHCGLPVPKGASDPKFCCGGCATVYELIHDADLERFYDLGGGRGRPVGTLQDAATQSSSREREWLPTALSEIPGVGLTQLEVDVQGLHCAACVWLLQELWRRRSGAVDIRINPALGRMQLVFQASQLEVTSFLDACESLGYRTGPVGKLDGAAERGLLVRLGVCVALALNAMVFALGEYFGMTEADGEVFDLFRWLSVALATAAVAVGGPVFFRAAFAGLRRKVLHLDLPIAIGIALGYGASLFAFATGLGDPYFDTVTVFVAFMVAGRFVQQRALRRNRDFLLAHDGTEHVTVRRLVAGAVASDVDATLGIERVPVAMVVPGDRLFVVPGDLLPVNARICGEAAAFSLDWIHGESEPRRFEPGAAVPAGAFAAGRAGVVVEATSTAAGSGLHRLLAVPAERDESVRDGFWARLNRIYVAIVLVTAAVAGIVWAFVDPLRVVDVVTAVLIVTCPCALGIATPLAFDLALARLRRQGVFVRRSALLEKARHVRRIVFDKTGTLTWGGVRIEERQPCPTPLRDVLFTMAQSSNHPISRAIADRLANVGRFLADLRVEDVPGRGMQATRAGSEYRLGGGRFATGADSEADEVVLTRDRVVVASFAVDEDYRAGAADELGSLRAAGYDVWLASGDRPNKVARAAALFGVPPERARGGMSPEDKAELLREIDASDTLMVGDGLNDALAFDAAFCAGTPALDRPVMPGRADFFYVGAGTGAVTAVLDGARRFHSVVRANLWLAGIYNAVALTLCLTGRMSPWLVAILMPLSSLLLVANTMRGIAAHRVDRVSR